MASASPSPSSSPSAVPPASNVSSPPPQPPLTSPSNSSTTSPTPPLSPFNQKPNKPSPSTPSNSSSPPPPVVQATPPPLTPLPPPPPLPTSPPLAPLISPPPTSPPPSPPPNVNSPLPPKSSPSPRLRGSPPASPVPPVLTPPPVPSIPSSSPPPLNLPLPPSSYSPPLPVTKGPENSSPPPMLAPPSRSGSHNSSPPSTPNVPSSLQPIISPPAPPGDSSRTGQPPNPSLPSFPTEKPTATSDGSPRDKGTGGHKAGGAVAIGIVLGFLAITLVVLAVWLKQRRKKRDARSNGTYVMPSLFASSQNSESSFLKTQPSAYFGGTALGSNFMHSPEPGIVGNSKAWFSYQELAEATNGFSASNLLGEGGFGCVYKGYLEDGREVAVKQLKIGGGQGEREFSAEVEIISRVHHRHLVSLVGYCISEYQRLLVYDYVPNDTLHYHLHGEGRPVMDWATRVKVAAGAARGIAYLHEDCNPRIIHRDIKSSNILLDNSFEARVADFGLAKLALDANTHVTTRVMGTFGYMAPEYASSGKLTEKSDVYSFGVVLLELITGRKPVDASQPLGDESLVEWARPFLTRALNNEGFQELVDPTLENSYVASEMLGMIEAAAACVRHLASKRPRMSQVVRALDALGESSDLTNGMKPGQSEIFNSREHSAQVRMFQRMAFGIQNYSSEFFNHSHSNWSS